MLQLIEFFVFLMVMTICYQFYRYALNHQGREKQDKCQTLGIVFFSVGMTSLVIRSVFFVFGGVVLMMFGLRLIAHGLDRIDKKIYIDQYTGDE